MIYGIATYNRPDILTIDTLLRNDIDVNDIVVATQSIPDKERIKKLYPDIQVIYKEGIQNVSGNRNQLLDYGLDEYMVLLDDDVADFMLDGHTLSTAIDKCVRYMSQNDIVSMNFCNGTCYNPYYDNTLMDWSMDGRMLVVNRNKCPRFRLDFDICEDTVFALDILERGQHCAFTSRFRIESTSCGVDGNTQGGCADAYKSGEFERCFQRMAVLYPKYFLTTWKTVFMWAPKFVDMWDW